MAMLRVWETTTEFKDWLIPERGVSLGRDVSEGSGIRLPQRELISKVHAEILPEPGGVWIIQDRSTNGTRVAGVEVKGLRSVLMDGVLLEFPGGGVRAVFYLDGPPYDNEPPYDEGTSEPLTKPDADGGPKPKQPPAPTLGVLLRDLQIGSTQLRRYALYGPARAQRMQASLDVLVRAAQDPDPEVARAALIRELDQRSVLPVELGLITEVFKEILQALDKFDEKINQAEKAGR